MRKQLIDREHPQLSIRRQCELLGVNRNRIQSRPRVSEEEQLRLRRAIDEIYLAHPYYGSRRITRILRRKGWEVGRDRVRREMRLMGVSAIYPRPRTSIQAAQNPVFPYLLRGRVIDRVVSENCADIDLDQ